MKYVILMFLFFSLSCQKSGHHEEPQSIEIDGLQRDIQMPKKILKDLDFDDFIFMSTEVLLSEKNDGVLKVPQQLIKLQRGGGEIDYSKWLGKTPGSFYVKFSFPEIDDEKLLRVWWISKSRPRKIGQELWGDRCHRAYEVTKLFLQKNTSSGLKINTSKNLHLTIMGGHFIFAFQRGRQLYMSQVTFMDSEKTSYFCEGFIP